MSLKSTPIAEPAAVYETNLPLPGHRRGKVRDLYTVAPTATSGPRMLIIASDRVSAFDVVLPTPVPGKGAMLTDISVRWFSFIEKLGLIHHHLISTDPADVDGLDEADRRQLTGRMMLGRAAEVIPVEFVVRGYLAGSGWLEYCDNGTVCGIPLPAGLERCGRLPEPIFTPATKADVGHDENIDFDRACDIAGRDVMEKLRDVSLHIYREAAKHAETRGIILADTKFEFGYAIDDAGQRTDELMLIDEALTPDSSRFWPVDDYEPGREQDSFDKQYVRNYLLELVNAGQWDKTPPGPELPDEIVRNTLARYEEARQKLFGERQRVSVAPGSLVNPSNMAKIIDGKQLALRVKDDLRQRVARLHEEGRAVRLDAILVGSEDAARLYARKQASTFAEVGIEHVLHELPADSGYDEIAERVRQLNADEAVKAIMVHLPLPAGVDTERIETLIDPRKDVEGVNPANIGNVVYGRRSLMPCTGLAAMMMIESTGIELRGTRCVCVGASNIVGKPLVVLLMRAEATVISTNVHTENQAALTREADVLIAAAGVPGLIKADMVKPGAIVIDVGINRVPDEHGKMKTVGDVRFDEVAKVAGYISPVPGGVGPMTVAMLLRNTVEAAEA